MKLITNFIYNDIVLYAKGWYAKKKSTWEDLAFLFSKIYAYKAKNEHETAMLMIKVLDTLYDELELNRNRENVSAVWLSSHELFENEVNKNILLYDTTRDSAIIIAVLCVLLNLTNKEIKLNPPHYSKKEYFRLGQLFGEPPISMTYKEMNKIAQKQFKNPGE